MSPRTIIFFAALFLVAPFTLLHAQLECKLASAIRTNSAPAIDGVQDSTWIIAKPATGFRQFQQYPGENASGNTEVRFMYDDNGLYVFARLYDSSPDSIFKQLGPRDEFQNNTDAFGIFLDTYHDRRNAFFFGVTAAGVQTDARYSFDKGDLSLNAVWQSAVKIDSLGWTAEMKIPYSAIRFPDNPEQVWGLNMERVIKRYREIDYWNLVDPSVSGVINQCGDLNGLSNIVSPVRLALFPYVSGYAENYDGHNSFSFNGGMDVKYGISKSFTLDATLIPDFGQTVSDNLVLNLSPVEVKFEERRYFFTEGTELFNKNDLFYSRRIGGRPPGYDRVYGSTGPNEIVDQNPDVTRLYNAIKLTGRTQNKLGVGVLNAVAIPAYATLRDTLNGHKHDILTSPLTNYNVFIIDKILKNNSYLGFVNTNVMREGRARDANVSSVQFRAGEKTNQYALEGFADVSNIFDPGIGPARTGYRYSLSGGKISGKYTAVARYRVVSDKFDPNDLGYLDRNNNIDYGLLQKYNVYKPWRKFASISNSIDLDLGYIFVPRHYTFFTITGGHYFTYKNGFTIGLNWLTNPIISYDYFEPRVPGRFLIYPVNYKVGGLISTDYRKKLAIDATVSYRIFLERNRTIFNYQLAPRIRISDKLFILYVFNQELKTDNVGYVAFQNDSLFFGLRDMNTVTNTLTANYIFNNKMSLLLRVRHYWSQADYKSYYLLNANGKVQDAYYGENADVSFNAFNIDAVLTWQFLPGSELSLVWKNAILASDSRMHSGYIDDAQYVFDSPQSNSISLKLIWYVDAGRWFREKN